MAKQETVAWKTVRDNYQRKGLRGFCWRGIAHRLPVKCNSCLAIANIDILVFTTSICAIGWIPDFHSQRTVILRQRFARLDFQDVDLPLVYKFKRSNTDSIVSGGGEFRCVRPQSVDPIVCCRRRSAHDHCHNCHIK